MIAHKKICFDLFHFNSITLQSVIFGISPTAHIIEKAELKNYEQNVKRGSKSEATLHNPSYMVIEIGVSLMCKRFVFIFIVSLIKP